MLRSGGAINRMDNIYRLGKECVGVKSFFLTRPQRGKLCLVSLGPVRPDVSLSKQGTKVSDFPLQVVTRRFYRKSAVGGEPKGNPTWDNTTPKRAEGTDIKRWGGLRNHYLV